jgi:predicted dehydrogenase
VARFAAIGLDHRHIYDLTQGLLDAGQVCAGYWPETDYWQPGNGANGGRQSAPLLAGWPEEKLEDAGGSGGGASVMAFSHEPHKALMTDFLDAIETGRDPAVTGEDALATQRVIASILSKGAG